MKRPAVDRDTELRVESEASVAAAVTRAAVWLFPHLMKLYPRQFHDTFADEMLEVFDMSLHGAAQGGTVALLRALFREYAELPLTLVSVWLYERRKASMAPMRYDTSRDVRLARWIARGLSLLFAGFVFAVVLFNEDVRADLTSPMLITAALALSALSAWRWERTGGLLTMALAPLLFLSILLQYAATDGLVTPLWALLLIAAAMALSFFIAGWLFVSVAQHTAVMRSEEAEDDVRRFGGRRRKLLAMAILGIAALLLFVIPLQVPVQQRVEAEPERYVDQAAIINALRAESASVSVGHAPVLQPFLSLPGQALIVNGEVVQVYTYPDTSAATTEASAIYYDSESAAWTEVAWQHTPHFYQVANVILIYDGHTPETKAILERAFGPPFAHQ